MNTMIRILFICHGNICRSPMAEYIMKKIVHDHHMSDLFEISSAATSYEEIGNDIYPPAKRILKANNVPFGIHHARHMEPSDEAYYDYIVGMDDENMYYLRRMYRNSPKISLLLDCTEHPREVSDPWYTRNFQRAYNDIYEGCTALLEHIMKET